MTDGVFPAKRRISRKVFVGGVAIGGGAPVSVQTMLNTKTTDVEASIMQAKRLADAGADLIRLAVPDEASAEAFGVIAARTGLPLIADIHYSYRLARLALEAGAAKIRMNPGNMHGEEELYDLALRMADRGVPVRVGVNGGSLSSEYAGMKEEDALVASALDCALKFEKAGLKDIVIALKHSDVRVLVAANRALAAACDYPLHLGLTEAGTAKSGALKSAAALGVLLGEGIGDTVRISLSAPPEEEVYAARRLLCSLGLRNDTVDVVSCPTCARTEIDVAALAEAVERATANIRLPLKIAVMGCPLNGIGEGKHADLGVAGGKEKSVIMKDGEIFETVPSELLMPHFMALLDEYVANYSRKSQKV